jgi:GPH family glycoside/pentoside/hexuronide:cation symporter
MPAEMTTDYHERSSIMSFRAAFLVGGGFLGGALAGPIIAKGGGGREGYEILGYILAAIVFISMMITVVFTRNARFTSFSRPTISRLYQARLFLANSPFLVLAGVKAFQFLQLAASGTSTLFFFVSVMNRDEALLFPFGSAVIAGSLLSLRLWLPIIRKWGKKNVMIVALLVQAVLYLSWLLANPAEDMPIFLLRGFLLGSMGGAILIASQSMIVDTIEYDRKLSGLNREGLYSSVFSFVEKMMHATGPLIIGILLATFGYDANIPRGMPQPESALLAIYLGQSILPAICSLLMVAVLIFYKLDEETLSRVQRHPMGEPQSDAVDEGATMKGAQA